MKAAIEISMDNDAFNDSTQGRKELSRILAEMAQRVLATRLRIYPIFDANGNNVGRLIITKDA